MKRRRVITIIAGLILIGLFTFYFTRSKEPSYEGKTLTQWLGEFQAHSQGSWGIGGQQIDHPYLTNSVHAIRAIGTNGIPTLLRMMKAKDFSRAEAMEDFVHGLGWTTFDVTHAEDKHQLAGIGFSVLGKDAQSAAQDLIGILKSDSVDSRETLVYSLREIDVPKEIGLPVLLQEFTNSNGRYNIIVARCLVDLYPDEAEKAGVYEEYPQMKPSGTNTTANEK